MDKLKFLNYAKEKSSDLRDAMNEVYDRDFESEAEKYSDIEEAPDIVVHHMYADELAEADEGDEEKIHQMENPSNVLNLINEIWEKRITNRRDHQNKFKKAKNTATPTS
jgi:hypothetical protein